MAQTRSNWSSQWRAFLRGAADEIKGFALFIVGRRRSFIFILSAQRTGSTLLKALLGEADDVSHLPEVRFHTFPRTPFAFYLRACQLSDRRIIVLKCPATFGAEDQYLEGLPRFWRWIGKVIVLYREVEPFLASIESAAHDINTIYRAFPLPQRINHWVKTYTKLVSTLEGCQKAIWISYEKLTESPVATTKELFAFIGSDRVAGTETYRMSAEVKWVWGQDDGGELIKTLIVSAKRASTTNVHEDLTAVLFSAKIIYQRMKRIQRKTRAFKPLDLSFLTPLRAIGTQTESANQKTKKLLAVFPLDKRWGTWGHTQSGVAFSQALQATAKNSAFDVRFLDLKAPPRMMQLLDAKDRWRFLIAGKRYDATARRRHYLGQCINRFLRTESFDAIFVFHPLQILDYVETKIPVVGMWDGVHTQAMEIFKFSQMNVDEPEFVSRYLRKSVQKCSLVVMPSQLSIEGVRQVADATLPVVQIPFGANFPAHFDYGSDAMPTKPQGVLELLFVSSDWERKGGHIALQTFSELQSRRVPVRLTIVGGEVAVNVTADPMLEFTGQLAKDDEGDLQRYRDILSRSHLLLLPSRAEFVPGIVREANLFGVPCLSTNVGAIPEMIQHNETGWLLRRDAKAFADKIEELWDDLDELGRVAQNAFEYGKQFTWHRTSQKVMRAIENHLS